MGDVINLRQARKRRQRHERAAEAAGNRAKFGRKKHERHADEDARWRLEQHVDGHRRVGDAPETDAT